MISFAAWWSSELREELCDDSSQFERDVGMGGRGVLPQAGLNVIGCHP